MSTPILSPRGGDNRRRKRVTSISHIARIGRGRSFHDLGGDKDTTSCSAPTTPLRGVRVSRGSIGSGNPTPIILFEGDVPPLRYEVVDCLALHLEKFGDSVLSKELFESFVQDPATIPLQAYKLDVVAEAFKMYFRLQKQSLLPQKVYQHFNSMIKFVTGATSGDADQEEDDNASSDAIEILVQLCRRLPVPHKPIFRRLLQFLWRVHQNSSVNLMTAANLSIIFGPILVQNMSEEGLNMTEIFEKSKEGVEMCRLLILNCSKLLSVLPEGRSHFREIGQAPMFPPDVLSSLAASGRPVLLKRGDHLLAKGKTNGNIFMVVDGALRISIVPTSEQCVLATKQHPFVGDVSLLGATVSFTQVTAATATAKVIKLDKAVIECFCVTYPAFARALYWSLAHMYAFLLRRYQKATTNVVQEKGDSYIDKNVQVAVVEKKTSQPVLLAYNEQDKFTDVLYEALDTLGMNDVPLEDCHLYQAPVATLDLSSKVYSLLGNESVDSLQEVQQGEGIYTLLNPHQPIKRVVLILVTVSPVMVMAPTKRSKSLSLSTSSDAEEIEPLFQCSCKIKNRKRFLQVLPAGLSYVSSSYPKETRNFMKYHVLGVSAAENGESLSCCFSSVTKKKQRMFTFDSEEDEQRALSFIHMFRTIHLNPEVRHSLPDVVGRARVSPNYHFTPFKMLPVKAGDIVLVSQNKGEPLAEYAGCIDSLSDKHFNLIEESNFCTTLVDSGAFTKHCYTNMPRDRQWNTLLNAGTNVEVQDGTIIALGERKQRLVLVLNGTCRVAHYNPHTDGSHSLMLEYQAEPGSLLGVQQLLQGGQSPIEVTADSSCEVCYVNGEDIYDIFYDDPSFCTGLLKTFACSLLLNLSRLD